MTHKNDGFGVPMAVGATGCVACQAFLVGIHLRMGDRVSLGMDGQSGCKEQRCLQHGPTKSNLAVKNL